MPAYQVNGSLPTLGRDVFIAATAVVAGDVNVGDESSLWFGAVVRGDCFPIRIGARTNLQDNVVVHVLAGQAATTIGDEVTIGHAAIVHGCTIGHRCLVGMGSIVLDGAVLGDDSLLAAGSLVTPGSVFPARSVIVGRPARFVRQVNDEDLQRIREGAENYVRYAREFITSCKEHRKAGDAKGA
jgi:carbonic anhydrase/acetyltransferase-like protein (isoleucine patch superfamily)